MFLWLISEKLERFVFAVGDEGRHALRDGDAGESEGGLWVEADAGSELEIDLQLRVWFLFAVCAGIWLVRFDGYLFQRLSLLFVIFCAELLGQICYLLL